MSSNNSLTRVADESAFIACRPRHLRSPQGSWMGEIFQAASRAMRALSSLVKRSASAPARTNARSDTSQWISPKKPLVLPKSEQQTISCMAGTVWITQGDSMDYVLNAGEMLALTPKNEVIVSAVRGSALVNRVSSC